MMKRRDFFKTALMIYLSNQSLFAKTNDSDFMGFFSSIFSKDEEKLVNDNYFNKSDLNNIEKNVFKKFEKEEFIVENLLDEEKISDNIILEETDIKDELVEVKKDLNKDLYVDEIYIKDFVSVRKKLSAIQKYIGYGNFNIVSFDEMLKIAKYSSSINAFNKSEIEFLEFIFYRDPEVHGFYGNRISGNITQTINKKEIIKIPRTGHYLFKGHPEQTYYKMVDDIGETIFLTSGIRSIVKQTKLFLDKVDSVNGNISVASKSLAPPAYTYHTIGDFDIGKKGLGYDNFTSRFALTKEFFAMRKLKYIDMRYTVNNKDGVRYEPWHIKII